MKKEKFYNACNIFCLLGMLYCWFQSFSLSYEADKVVSHSERIMNHADTIMQQLFASQQSLIAEQLQSRSAQYSLMAVIWFCCGLIVSSLFETKKQ